MKLAVSTKAVVEAYIEAINAHDVASIVALSAPDHEFVDAFGGIVPAEKLTEAWTGYFAFMPRYGIEIDEIICDGEVAAAEGRAGALYIGDPDERLESAALLSADRSLKSRLIPCHRDA